MPIDLTNPSTVRALTAEESDRLKLYYGTSLAPSPRRDATKCVTCKGAGKFRWWDDPTSAEKLAVEYECPCVSQWVLHRFFLNAGVDLSHQRLSWADMQWVSPDIMQAFDDYLYGASQFVANGLGMILHGDKGTGKTALAVLTLKTLLASGYDGYFTTFNDMTSMFTAGWRDPEEQMNFHRQVKNATVLVIDDPGRESVGATKMHSALIDEVLRHRVAGLRPTIVTTNLSLTEFQMRYGEYVMSLLHERSRPHEFVGDDVRKVRMQDRLWDEISQGLTRPVVWQ